MSTFELPSQKGVVFWPVGTGDSTTIAVKPQELMLQIDLRHLEKAESADDPEWPIIDHLVRVLPRRNGRPYLAVFALTHPEQDHVQGFAELLRRVHIGELWHTPKIFRDLEDEVLCDDAEAFRQEAHRRCHATLRNPGSVSSGDRLRVIGHDDVLNESPYRDLPDDCKSHPGDLVSLLDGRNVREHFQAFIHAPFSDDQASDRNNTSLSLNVVLWDGQQYAQFFFFGDREYPTIKRIFDSTEANGNEGYLGWHVMLCSHHCSKRVMYWQDEGDQEATLKRDILKVFENYARDGAYIVSSSHVNFTDGPGDNPPHAKARRRYEEIVSAGHFLCTHEYPSKQKPQPLVFTLERRGLQLADLRSQRAGAAALIGAVATARGAGQPPGVQLGFGRSG